MPQLLYLLRNEETVYVNMNKIEFVDYDDEGVTQIHMDSGQIVKVDELIGDIAEMIEKAKS
jgi:hypothetical protein